MFETQDEDMRTFKPVPLLYSLIISILLPPVIAVVFSIIGAGTNPFLLQVELILFAILFCLMGILTRSKLIGLLNIFTAPISWFIISLLSTLTSGFIVNPYGLFQAIAPVLTALTTSGLPLDQSMIDIINMIAQYAFIIDLVVVILLAFFLGFFLSMIATGFWNKKGEFKIISVIFKPIAVVFVLLLIISIPFTYHALGKASDGALSLVAGMAELQEALGIELGAGVAAQEINLDLTDPAVLEALTEASKDATKWFKRSADAFDHVRGNILLDALLGALPAEYATIEGINIKESTELLRVVNALAELVEKFPNLLYGFLHLTNGFETTFNVIGETDLGGGFGSGINQYDGDYDSDLIDGLNEIVLAVNNFTEAEESIGEAFDQLDTVFELAIDDETAGPEVEQIKLILSEISVGFPALLDLGAASVPFLNGTYKTALAVGGLGNSDFPRANYWLKDGTDDLVLANTTMQSIDLELFDINSIMPFYGAIKIIRDMTNLLGLFTSAAVNGTDCYMAIDDSLDMLNSFNVSEAGTLNWANLDSDINAATVFYNAAIGTISQAKTLGESLTEEDNSYGALIDDSIKPILNEFSTMLNTFYDNITDIGSVLGALSHTVATMRYFTEAADAFEYGIAQASDPGISNFTEAKELFELAINSSAYGANAVDEVTFIGKDAQDTWAEILWGDLTGENHPSYYIAGAELGDTSIYRPVPYDLVEEEPLGVASIAEYSLGLIEQFENVLESADPEAVELILGIVESLDLSAIFGSG